MYSTTPGTVAREQLQSHLSQPYQRCQLLLGLGLALCLPPAARAAVSTWDGGGVDSNWTTATNWVGDVLPSPGDDLVFPLGVPRLSLNNDFPDGTAFNSIVILGPNYTLNGSRVVLSAGISVSASVANNVIFLPITLAADQTFTVSNASFSAALYLRGPIDLGSHTLTLAGPGFFQVLPVISGSGGIQKTSGGGALLYGTNTFTGPVNILDGSISIYRAQALGATNSGTTVATNASLTLSSAGGSTVVSEPLTLAGTLGGVSVSYRWIGPITLTSSNATVNVNAADSPLSIEGVVSGNGGLQKSGAGTLTLTATNTYTNQTVIYDGVLRVDGVQPQSSVVLLGGALSGTGFVGNVTCSGSFFMTVSPGDSIGILSVSNVSFSSNTIFAVELNGAAPGTGYDQLNVNGTVNLAGAILSASLGFSPPVGASFVVINNDGADAVAGTFAGLTNGAVVSISGTPFQISYTGGSGNDVVLTRISPPTKLTSITRLANGPAQLNATGGLAGFSYTLWAATNLSPPVQWSNLGAATASVSGSFRFTDTNAPLFPMRFYRALSP